MNWTHGAAMNKIIDVDNDDDRQKADTACPFQVERGMILNV